MQTPAGYAMNDAGQFVPVDWWAIIFNPSFPYRLVHMVLAAYLATAFVVGATGAYHLLHGRQGPMVAHHVLHGDVDGGARRAAAGSSSATSTASTRWSISRPRWPRWKDISRPSMTGAPLILFGLPDMQAGETRYAIEVPKLGSLILTHDLNGTLKGLKSCPREDWPRVPIVFWSFRVMVGLGLLMIATGLVSLWLDGAAGSTTRRSSRAGAF